jgi:sulfatase modifying factor 1
MQASLYRDPPFLQKRLRQYEVNGCVFYTVVVEKGRFWMGDDDSEYDDEKPAHPVDIRHDYELGVQPVTQALWRAVMDSDPEELYFAGDERPVEGVSWDDIRGPGGFLEKLNAQLLQDAQGVPFCLPTEAQWEYAVRGGRLHPHAGQLYAGSSRLDEVGWYDGNSGSETHAVGQQQRNVLGLHDMSGNVLEWVEDDWHGNYDKAPANEGAWTDSPRGHYRVLRGGCWGTTPGYCRVSFRSYGEPEFRDDDVGFRLARSSSSL